MKTYTESKRIRPDILTAALYWSVVIIMVYNVASNRIIGDKGAYYVAAPFALMCLFYCGIILACQKAVYVMVRLRARRSQYLNAEDNMQRSLRIFGAAGLLCAVLVFVLGYSFGEKLFGTDKGVFQMAITAVCVAIMGIQGVMRGYLQGIGYTRPILISDLIISVVSLISGLLLSAGLYNYGLKVNSIFHVDEYSAVYGSSGIMLGCLIGIFAGFLQILISYNIRRSEIKEFVKGGAPRYLDSKNDVFSGFRIILLMYITPALVAVVDEAYYVIHTRRVHEDVDFITNYGIYSGKILSSVALLTLLCCVPFIKFWNRVMARIERDEYEGARDRFKRLIHYASLLVIPAGVFVLAIPDTVLVVLFGKSSDLADKLMMIGGVTIMAASVAVFFSWLLNHMGRSLLIILNVGIGWGVHLVLLLLFVTVLDIGVYGVLTALLLALIAYDVLCAVMIFRYLKLKRHILNMLVPPLFASAGAGFVVFLLNMLLVNVIGNLLTMLLGIVVFFVVYMLLLIVSRGLKTDELDRVPLGFLFAGFAANVQHSRSIEE
jgi:O-antigen/teichoic acid export membrane protein